MLFHFQRIVGYIIGFILFYAPFALFQRLLNYILHGVWQMQTIHSLCLRIPLEHILDGKIFRYASVSAISTVLLLLSAFFFGPLFCGRLCPAGAFTEYISKLIPAKMQISWKKYTEVAPIRYGMLAGFCLLPFWGGILACAYCNFFLFDLLANYYTQGYFISLSSSLLLTGFLWIVVFGLFTKGGRGFCNFLCPVGAAQSLMHSLGCRLPFAWRMQVNQRKCIGCGRCVRNCSMEAVSLNAEKAQISQHNCITCGVCKHNCPVKAISYGRKDYEK